MKNHFGKTILSTPGQDLNLDLPVICNLVYCESSVLAATKVLFTMPFYGDISEGLPVQLRAAVEARNSGLPSIRACFPNSIPPPNSSYNNTDQNAYQEQRDFQMSKAQSRSTLLSESSREHQSLSPLHSNGYLQHPTTVGTTNERMVGGLATSVINTNVSSPSTIHTSCSPTMYTNNPQTSQYNVGTSETSDSGVNKMSNWTSYQKVFPPKTQQQLPHNYNRPKNTSTILRGPLTLGRVPGPWCCRQGGTDTPTTQHLGDGCYHGIQTEDEQDDELTSDGSPDECIKKLRDDIEMLKNNSVKRRMYFCTDSSEPGLYYTHLGAAASITDLRSDLETRTGVTKNALRIEKIVYTGKEGSTVQGCPLAKWIIRRESYDEKLLCVVKHRKGHTCSTAWIVVVIVAWEGVSSNQADDVYNMLVHKLNRYGLPNTRRCATNKPRTCACQGLDPNTCGASFTFGCSWSMYYNSCKYVRSKTVRKFRLSVISEEEEIEDRLQDLATMLTPLYKTLAPQSFKYQTQFEHEASDCRLGLKPGRPFSGVTACVDFCAHSHRDFNNMNNGCTVVVTLTKHRSLSKPADEQLHVLPLYVMDETDEFGSKEGQEAKARNGSIESLTKFPCEVRVRSVPLLSCKRQGKKRKEEANERKEHAMIQQGFKGAVQSIAVSTPTNRTTGIALAHTTKVSSSSLAFGNTAPGDENWGNHRPMADSNTEPQPYTSSHEGRTSQSDSHLSHHQPSLNEHVHPEQNYIHQQDLNGKNSENKVKKMCGPLSSHGGWVTPKKLNSSQNSSPYNSENAQWSPYMHTQVDPHSQSPTNLYSDSTKNKIDNSPSLGSVNTDNGAHFSSNTIGEVTDYIDNEESFKNLHIGGVAIALGHGSVLFECAKHELHATTALKRPNRLEPTRISLVFYQHRNLNRPKHGGCEWEEKMRLKKLGITTFPPMDKVSSPSKKVNIVSGTRSCDKALSVPKGLPPTFSCPTYPTTTWTTLFPMHPCILVGPYQLKDAKV
uniref:Methylcytosine dioxygenase TET n=1 Tax=Timema douglasi TaxID=61478 RepID=A0A7R8Z5W0_TIMDO|nr:unnamed protein product [Timema douglasi]